MTESPQVVSSPENGVQRHTGPDDWDGLDWLVPLLGEANVRRLLDNPPTEAQRRRIRQIIAEA